MKGATDRVADNRERLPSSVVESLANDCADAHARVGGAFANVEVGEVDAERSLGAREGEREVKLGVAGVLVRSTGGPSGKRVG